MKKNWRIPHITRKVLSGIIVAGFLLCTLFFFAGFVAFSRVFTHQYDASIRSIAEACRET